MKRLNGVDALMPGQHLVVPGIALEPLDLDARLFHLADHGLVHLQATKPIEEDVDSDFLPCLFG